MALSNYRAYYERTYYSNGSWKTEAERECGQLDNSQSYPDGYFQAYRETMPCTRGLSGITISALGDACYAAFGPGKMYLPKKYYTLNDLFNPADITSLWDFLYETMIQHEATSPGTYFQNNYYYHSKNIVFWKSASDAYIVPYFDIRLNYSPYYHTWQNSMNLSYIVTPILPSKLYSSWELNGWRSLDTGDDVELKWGTDVLSNGNLLKGTMHENNPNVPSSPKLGDVKGYYDKLMEQFSKVRFHPMYGSGESIESASYDGVYYFKKKTTYGTNSMYFLCNLIEVPYIPVGGFIVLGQNASINFITRITSNGGPDPNDPYEEDDPYDEDDDDDDDSGGDGDHDDTDEEVPRPSLPPISGTGVGLMKVYNPNSSQLQEIADKLWSPDFLEAFKQYFNSPMEAILGLAIVPVNPSTGSSRSVHLGGYDTQVSAPVVDSDYVIINCGSIPINRYWGSYLDYDPYTKISCFLPYIGEIDINPDQVMQKNLGLYYYVNVISGDIVAVLTADGSVFATAAGNCIRQLPIGQQDYSAIINTAVTAVGALAVGVATAGAGAASVGATAARAGVSSAAVSSATAHAASANVSSGASLLGSVTNAKKHYQHAGQIGTGSGQLGPQKAFLTIERPNLDLADSYKSFVGYPCNKTLQLKECHGYTQIEATKLSVPSATDEEIAEIIEILSQGVLL